MASMTTPVLLNRCRLTLQKYTTDEAKVGSAMITRLRTAEVVFILEELRQLDGFPDLNHEPFT